MGNVHSAYLFFFLNSGLTDDYVLDIGPSLARAKLNLTGIPLGLVLPRCLSFQGGWYNIF